MAETAPTQDLALALLLTALGALALGAAIWFTARRRPAR
jgi:hypothetical protein